MWAEGAPLTLLGRLTSEQSGKMPKKQTTKPTTERKRVRVAKGCASRCVCAACKGCACGAGGGARGACEGGVCKLTRPRPGQTGDASPVWRRPSGDGEEWEPRPRWPAPPVAGGAAAPPQGGDPRSAGLSVQGPSQADGGQGSRAPASRSRGPGGQPTSVCVCCRARPPSTDAHAGPAPQGETPAHGHGAGASPRAATVRGADRPTARLPATRRLSRTRHSQAGMAGGQVAATTQRRRARERGSVFRNRETDGTSPRCGSRGRRPS